MNSFLKLLFLLALSQSFIIAEKIKLIKEGGTYSVPVIINDAIKLNFVVDSGAADVTIPYDVFSTLQRTGTITKADILEEKKYEMANGSIEQYYTFNIRNLKIGNQYIYNIQAAASKHMKGALLLGQSALKKLEPWGLDTSKHVIYIKEKQGLPKNVKQSIYTKKPHQWTEAEREEISHNFEKNLPAISSKIQNNLNKYIVKCDNENFKACESLASLYLHGEEWGWVLGIKQNVSKSIRLYNKACTGGYIEACSALANIYGLGTEGVKKDKRKALKYNIKACNGGNAYSCFMIGLEHLTGKLIKKDNKKAVKLFRKSCRDDFIMACASLADMYIKGQGVRQDIFKAVKIYQKACNSNIPGYAESCVPLAFLYWEGKGVRQNYKKAKELFGRACDGGFSFGCEMYSKFNKH